MSGMDYEQECFWLEQRKDFDLRIEPSRGRGGGKVPQPLTKMEALHAWKSWILNLKPKAYPEEVNILCC